MGRGECEDMGRGATTEVERRSVRAVPGLPDFLKVLEGPFHESAALLEQGKDGRPDEFHHLGRVILVPLDESRRFPRALENARTLPLKCKRHVA